MSDPVSPYEMLEPHGHLRTDPSARPERADPRPHERSAVRASKTLWAAVDYLVLRSSPDYASAEPADRAPGNGGKY